MREEVLSNIESEYKKECLRHSGERCVKYSYKMYKRFVRLLKRSHMIRHT